MVDGRPGRVAHMAQKARRLTWRAAPRATGYALAFETPTGTVTRTVRVTHATVPAGATSVMLVGTDVLRRAGGAVTKELRR